MERIIKATLISGLAPGLLAPALWPVVVLFMEGRWPAWSVYPTAALVISFFAMLVSVPICVMLGSTAIYGLEKINLNTPFCVGIAGLAVAFLVYVLIADLNGYPSLKTAWPLAAYFSTLGAVCGVLASIMSRTNHALKMDRANRAAL